MRDCLSDHDLEAMLERAAEEGARRALSDVGLGGDEAALDIRDLRSLIDCIRLARRTALQTAVRMITSGVMLALPAGTAIRVSVCQPVVEYSRELQMQAADQLALWPVTDFLDFCLATIHGPAFNLADVAIVSGVGILLLESILPRDEAKGAKEHPDVDPMKAP